MTILGTDEKKGQLVLYLFFVKPSDRSKMRILYRYSLQNNTALYELLPRPNRLIHKVVNSIYWLCCINANYIAIFLHFETDTSFENITTAHFSVFFRDHNYHINIYFFATVSCWIAWCLPTCYGPRVKLPLKKRVLLKTTKNTVHFEKCHQIIQVKQETRLLLHYAATTYHYVLLINTMGSTFWSPV